MPEYLSNSQLAMFNFCLFQYKLHYIDNFRPERTIELMRGGLIHKVIENFYKEDKDLVEGFKEKYIKQIGEDEYYYQGIEFFKKYKGFFEKINPLEIEKDIIKKIGSLKIRTIADILLADIVLDWKTSSKTLKKLSDSYKKQLITYCVTFRKKKGIIVNLHIPGNQISVLKYKYNRGDAKSLMKEFKKFKKIRENKKFSPTGRKRGVCNVCSYNEWCIHYRRLSFFVG